MAMHDIYSLHYLPHQVHNLLDTQKSTPKQKRKRKKKKRKGKEKGKKKKRK
jgi:hypothetical protein